jgi:hypothetical protein
MSPFDKKQFKQMTTKRVTAQLGTAWMRDKLIEEFRNRPEHSTHDALVESIIDRVYHEAMQKEYLNQVFVRTTDGPLKSLFRGPLVERKKVKYNEQ